MKLTPLSYLIYCVIVLPPIAVAVWVIAPARWIQAVVTFVLVFAGMRVTSRIERYIKRKREGRADGS